MSSLSNSFASDWNARVRACAKLVGAGKKDGALAFCLSAPGGNANYIGSGHDRGSRQVCVQMPETGFPFNADIMHRIFPKSTIS